MRTVAGKIAQELADRRRAVVHTYADDWTRMIRAWRQPRNNDAVWLMFAANYLFNSRGRKWAVDPIRLCQRLPEAPPPPDCAALKALDFVLLTHAHADHVDPGLWQELRESSCTWIVPEHMTSFFAAAGMMTAPSIVAVPGEKIRLGDIEITPFTSPHGERLASGCNRVESTGYYVKTPDRAFLFPVDVRTYDPACLAPFPPGATVFAHVFLGRGAALLEAPPLVDDFVNFYLHPAPGKIVLTHLYELARAPEDCWLASHARMVRQAFAARDARLEIIIPDWFEETLL